MGCCVSCSGRPVTEAPAVTVRRCPAGDCSGKRDSLARGWRPGTMCEGGAEFSGRIVWTPGCQRVQLPSRETVKGCVQVVGVPVDKHLNIDEGRGSVCCCLVHHCIVSADGGFYYELVRCYPAPVILYPL